MDLGQHSEVFKASMDAFLSQVQARPHANALTKSLRTLKERLGKVDAKILQSPLYKKAASVVGLGTYELQTPKNFQVVGSFLLKSDLAQTADLAVEMPSYSAENYIEQRECFLAALAAAASDIGKVQYELLNGKTVLRLNLGDHSIRIIPSISPETVPSEACREIASDAQFGDHLKFIHAHCKDVAALLLLKQWALCRGFSGFVISMIYAHLCQTGVVPHGTAYQQLRPVLHFLASFDPSSRYSMCESDAQGQSANAFDDAACFADPSGTVNLLAHCSMGDMQLLATEAKFSLECLDAQDGAVFALLFSSQEAFRFDEEFSVAVCDIEQHERAAQIAAFALGARAKALVSLSTVESWEIGQKRPESNIARFGVVLDQSCAYRKVDFGPACGDPDTEAFKAFWGKKSELRKFKDGKVCEALVWDDDKYEIPRQVVRHAIMQHMNVDVIFSGSSLDFTLHKIRGDFGAAFEALATQLRAIKELPLHIVRVASLSAAWRRSALSTQPHETIIAFESSPEWPRDAIAAENYRAAFYVRLAELVKDARPTMHFVDIARDGFVFRVRIGSADSSECLMSAALHELVLANPIYGDSCIAVKRFVHAQMLPIPELILDLLCAVLFLPGRDNATPPGHYATGFKRFLKLVARLKGGLVANFGRSHALFSESDKVRVILPSLQFTVDVAHARALRNICANALRYLHSPKSLFVPNFVLHDAVFFFRDGVFEPSPLALRPPAIKTETIDWSDVPRVSAIAGTSAARDFAQSLGDNAFFDPIFPSCVAVDFRNASPLEIAEKINTIFKQSNGLITSFWTKNSTK